MTKTRTILHSDANSFYASVETVLDPSLAGKAVAVCGSTEERHGIVLAKSEKAKKAGVKTGMANWQARDVCPELIIVHPQYEYYLKFSRLLHGIYQRYTDLMEPFGMDECWLDVTHSGRPGPELAEEIRNTVREELGLTVSIGVSFNKIFAKLGSDMKKPDAVTVITQENFREKVWPLDCGDLLYCGRATTAKLHCCGVFTIGDLAALPEDILKSKLGKNGVMLWRFANGLDTSRVAHQEYVAPAKSVGHGITCAADLENGWEAHKVLVALSQDVGRRLRAMNLRASAVQLFVRDNRLCCGGWQMRLPQATQEEGIIAAAADRLLENYPWTCAVRSLTVSAIRLEPADGPLQTDLFIDPERRERRARLNRSLDALRERFGKNVIFPAVVMDEHRMPPGADREILMPGFMYQ